ncbi:MAG: hypothetical protein COB66_07950 [Coxiella sp. (in: Bacteria)]|nr:MAG: hypothetical protein COB66_07950 [Coxiella sp. (in: g-proteobacteria)]
MSKFVSKVERNFKALDDHEFYDADVTLRDSDGEQVELDYKPSDIDGMNYVILSRDDVAVMARALGIIT